MTIGFPVVSIENILRTNERVHFAIMGVNNRGHALAASIARQKNAEIVYIFDVEAKVLEKGVDAVKKATGKEPLKYEDFRKALDDKSIDGLIIAAPDHWHASAAILACKAGKHVYVEKPCSHNQHEGELLIKAARKP